MYQVVDVIYGPVAQLVRAPPCHGGGHRFKSDTGREGVLAQLGEHLPYKQRVTGSSPVGPIRDMSHKAYRVFFIIYIDKMPAWRNWQTPGT